MASISSEVFRLEPRLARLEEWLDTLQSPHGPAEQSPGAWARFTDAVAEMERDLYQTWQHLLEYSANITQNRASIAPADDRFELAQALVELMRKLIDLKNRQAVLLGQAPAEVPNQSLESVDPKLALPVLARTTNRAEANRYVRRKLHIGWAASIKKPAIFLFGLLFLLLICAVGAFLLRSPRPSGSQFPTRTAQPTQNTANLSGSAGTAAATSALGTPPTTPIAKPTSAEPTLVEPTAAPTEPPTEPPTAQPTAEAATPTPSPKPPTPTPSPKPPTPTSPRPTSQQPPVRAFAPEIQVTFAGLPDSRQKKSCVNGQVLDRRGNGISSALLQINNGVSFSERKPTNNDGYFEFCNLGASKWSVVLNYVPNRKVANGAVAVIEVNGQEGQFARVIFRER